MLLLSRAVLGLALLSQVAVAANSEVTFHLDSAIHKVMPFRSNSGYLAMNINYSPIKDLFPDVQEQAGSRLLNRGEAHITVLAPQEYSALAGTLGGSRINGIAQKSALQGSSFETVCVGTGSARMGSKSESTYFVVVKSPDLIAVRQALLDAYKSAGGDGEPFEAEHFYPHITIGYTKTDLHEEQGVIKDESSCIGSITEAP